MIVSSQEDERLYGREHAHVASQSSQRMTYRTGMRDMGGYLIPLLGWAVQSLILLGTNYHKISNKLQLVVSLAYCGNFISR